MESRVVMPSAIPTMVRLRDASGHIIIRTIELERLQAIILYTISGYGSVWPAFSTQV